MTSHGAATGGKVTPEYSTWMAIKSRCHSTTNKNYPKYGGAGITVCQRWRDSFQHFLDDVGHKPGPEYSLDRLDGSLGYEPGNVKWATAVEQRLNQKSTIYLTLNGTTKQLIEWSVDTGIPATTLRYRRTQGWSDEKILTTPLASQYSRPRPSHSGSRTPEYAAWARIKGRCYNKNDKDYAGYGGAGVTVAECWRESFPQFLMDVGVRPGPGYSLDRIDGSRGYEPGNVRWATTTEQCRNLKTNRYLTLDGQSRTVAEWSELTGVGRNTITRRIDVYGWSEERALTAPITYPTTD